MANHQTNSPSGARTPARFHHQDRTAAGISRTFQDAALDLPDGMAERLATRIAAAGGWRAAYDALCAEKGSAFQAWTTDDRCLAELVKAEDDADHPETALASLLQVLPLPASPIHPGARERDFRRAARLLARIDGVAVTVARDRLDAWAAQRSEAA